MLTHSLHLSFCRLQKSCLFPLQSLLMLFYQLSRLHCGWVPSHSMDTFVYLPKISVLHWKWITACLSIQIVPYTKVPWSLLCASVHCCTPLLAVLARILEAKPLSLIHAKLPDPMVTVPLYPMEAVLNPAKTTMYCYAVMAVSIIIVWKVPKLLVTLIVLQPISVTKKCWRFQ